MVIRKVNKTVQYVLENPCQVKFPKLSADSLPNVGYKDARYTGNYDITSQLGRLVLLIDDYHAVAPISYTSYKSKRVSRSVL